MFFSHGRRRKYSEWSIRLLAMPTETATRWVFQVNIGLRSYRWATWKLTTTDYRKLQQEST